MAANDCDNRIEYLKDQIMTMIDLVRLQLGKAYQAFLTTDKDLAAEVIHYEGRVNGLELSIDADCEMIFNKYHLQGTKLRFMLSVLKINTQLERIGDHAELSARFVIELHEAFPKEILERAKLNEIWSLVMSMLSDISQGFNFESGDFSRLVFTKELDLRHKVQETISLIMKDAEENPAALRQYFYLISFIRACERIGELTKNIAEETIFYLDAHILRHKDK
jgi:phosphate transport system protein